MDTLFLFDLTEPVSPFWSEASNNGTLTSYQ